MPEKLPEIKEEDFEGYGSEMIDLVTLVKGQANKLDDLKGQVQNVGERVFRSDEEEFYRKLAKQVSDWRTINNSKEFVDWLAEKDPFVGVTRQALLDDAHSDLDLDRAVHFFNAFKGGGTTVSRPSDTAQRAANYTVQDITKASKDYQTGRITEEQFNKIANQVQTSYQKGALT